MDVIDLSDRQPRNGHHWPCPLRLTTRGECVCADIVVLDLVAAAGGGRRVAQVVAAVLVGAGLIVATSHPTATAEHPPPEIGTTLIIERAP